MTPTSRTDTTLAAEDILAFTPFFKAFCNDTRASIVEQLLGGERCVCELTTDMDASQPLISHHLAILKEAGFVRSRSEGTRTYYAIDWQAFFDRLVAFLDLVDMRREAGAAREAAEGDPCRAGDSGTFA
jgi:DNA-binding transcriptional ArsR family regulator